MKHLIISLLLVASIPCHVFAETVPVERHPEVASNLRFFESWIKSQIAYQQIPGISIGIVYDQELIYAKGFGYADREKKIAAGPGTVYRIGSISKLFTSIAIMRLRDEGKLQLDDPVEKHLSWFKIRQKYPEAPVITIRHLLTHTSGLPRDAAFPYWTDFNFPTREQIIEMLPKQETVYPAETKWKYSNLGLTLAGEIVAAVSGEPYDEYIRTNILELLGMTGTSVTIGKNDPRLVVGYGRRMPDGSRAVMRFTDARGITPAANLSSTVEDLARFVAWQLRLRESGGREILKSSTIKEMQRVHWLHSNWEIGWGLGF